MKYRSQWPRSDMRSITIFKCIIPQSIIQVNGIVFESWLSQSTMIYQSHWPTISMRLLKVSAKTIKPSIMQSPKKCNRYSQKSLDLT